MALVIGNSAYAEGRLGNPVNDARAMDQKLSSLGFSVTRVENLRRQQIGRTVKSFVDALKPGDEVVFFYAGYGVQVKGVNYLPAVDADIQGEDDVPLNSLNLNSLLERLEEAKAGMKLLFLDACRNNPYARSFRSAERGLARVAASSSGTLMHFATRPGGVAADGTGANGLYTSMLLRHIDAPDLPVQLMLKRVTAAVEAESRGSQEPWTEGSIRGDFYFRRAVQVVARQAPSSSPTPTLPPPALTHDSCGPRSVRVRFGDTLIRIALENGLNWRDLQRWNGIANPNITYVGQPLVVGDTCGEGFSVERMAALGRAQDTVFRRAALAAPGEQVKGGVITPSDAAEEATFVNTSGNTLRSLAPGRVTEVDARVVVVLHSAQLFSVYKYEGTPFVRPGETVQASTPMATMVSADDGRSGARFSIQVWRDNEPVAVDKVLQ